jgi:hypothetical protein
VGSNLGLEIACPDWNIHGFPRFFLISFEAVPGIKQQLLPSINFQINTSLKCSDGDVRLSNKIFLFWSLSIV